jgi:hypothetical protein
MRVCTTTHLVQDRQPGERRCARLGKRAGDAACCCHLGTVQPWRLLLLLLTACMQLLLGRRHLLLLHRAAAALVAHAAAAAAAAAGTDAWQHYAVRQGGHWWLVSHARSRSHHARLRGGHLTGVVGVHAVSAGGRE